MTAEPKASIPPAVPPQCEWLAPTSHHKQREFSRLIYSYSRVSTGEQYLKGLSLEEQEYQAKKYIEWLQTTTNEVLRQRLEMTGVLRDPAAKEFAAFANYTYAGHYVEDPASARKVPLRERPVGKVLWERLRPGDTIVFTKFNRAFRGVADFQATSRWFERGAITMHFLDLRLDLSNPGTADLIMNIMAAVSEWEARNISEQTKAGMQVKRRRGDKLGGIPTGMGRYYWIDKHGQNRSDNFYIREDIAILRWCAWIRRRHGWSWTRIAERLEEVRAWRDGRKPLPQSGIAVDFETRKANEENRISRVDYGLVKNGMVTPLWRVGTVQAAAEAWDKICGNETVRRKWPAMSKPRKLLASYFGTVGAGPGVKEDKNGEGRTGKRGRSRKGTVSA